jgi:hypothetical protein
MVDIEIVREWIEKANEDFEFARVNFKKNSPFFAQICFLWEMQGYVFILNLTTYASIL